MHCCPVFTKQPTQAWTAAASRSASANTMLADLPPSSSEAGTSRRPAASATRRPVAVEPVNATTSTPGWSTSGAPVSEPEPVTQLTTPGGKPASAIRSISFSTGSGASSDGLTTTVLPAASAGAKRQSASDSGEFHGTIAATTPRGSWMV